MSVLNTTVTTEQGGRCGICLRDFAPGDPQLTHVGGTHDGFHPHELINWLQHHPSCPTCRTPISEGIGIGVGARGVGLLAGARQIQLPEERRRAAVNGIGIGVGAQGVGLLAGARQIQLQEARGPAVINGIWQMFKTTCIHTVYGASFGTLAMGAGVAGAVIVELVGAPAAGVMLAGAVAAAANVYGTREEDYERGRTVRSTLEPTTQTVLAGMTFGLVTGYPASIVGMLAGIETIIHLADSFLVSQNISPDSRLAIFAGATFAGMAAMAPPEYTLKTAFLGGAFFTVLLCPLTRWIEQ